MRILMLTPRFPYPPDRGDTVRSWTILRGLAGRHEVWLACLGERPPPAQHLERVRRICRETAVFVSTRPARLWRGARSLLTGGSFTAAYFHDPRFVRIVSRWSRAAPFDALLTYSSSIAPAADAVAAERRVLDLCDVDSAKWRDYARQSLPPLRWLYGWEARRVAELERRAADTHDLCLLVNERERRKFEQCVPGAAAAVLPTTVTVADFAGLASLPAEPVIGMVGSMFYPPNVRAVSWFGRQVWPLVRRDVPGARWLIVGGSPARGVRRWAGSPGVEITGYVADVRPYLRSMRVFVNAVQGDLGVQSKTIVALAAGRPAVVTPDCAAGIDYDDPPPFLVASSPAQFAEAVVRLLRDDALARGLATRARVTAAARYDAALHIERLEHWLGGGRQPIGRALPAAAVAVPGRVSPALVAGGEVAGT